MFRELINVETQRGGIDFMVLEFTKGNERAKALNRKFGFEIVSEKPNVYKLKDGTYQSIVYMQK
jgi:ribosomal protein S18 acetylase RimI-like enzyme